MKRIDVAEIELLFKIELLIFKVTLLIVTTHDCYKFVILNL